jgi:hypothetical protein
MQVTPHSLSRLAGESGGSVTMTVNDTPRSLPS